MELQYWAKQKHRVEWQQHRYANRSDTIVQTTNNESQKDVEKNYNIITIHAQIEM